MITTNVFFRKDDGIKIFDHQASSSKAVAQKCSQKLTVKLSVKLTVENPCRTWTQVLFCQFRKIFKNTFFTEHFRWLLFPTLKPLDSLRQ